MLTSSSPADTNTKDSLLIGKPPELTARSKLPMGLREHLFKAEPPLRFVYLGFAQAMKRHLEASHTRGKSWCLAQLFFLLLAGVEAFLGFRWEGIRRVHDP